MITRIEELSFNAWPAPQIMALEGWLLRFAGGYTRRANSILPLYAEEGDPSARIMHCEALYRTRNLPAVFKLTTASRPSGLDVHLESAGYRIQAPTSVKLLDLSAFIPPESLSCEFSSFPSADWEQTFARLHMLNDSHRAIHSSILASILPECCFAVLRLDGQVASCGLGVLEDGYLGLFDIIVDPAARRMGLGECLVRDLLVWGKRKGAHQSYLQVMKDNAPARALYAKLGYREAYAYWYRVKG